jgi:4-amino-4-deoxy-L-arabinose transferase-like glycosyltransferase
MWQRAGSGPQTRATSPGAGVDSTATTIQPTILLLAGITLVAAFLRFWQLDATPPGFHYDEAYEGLEAWQLLTNPAYRPIVFTGNFGVEPMFIYLTSLAFRLFGVDPVVQRGVAALIGTLAVPAVWLLAHELRQWDRRLPASFALWAAIVQTILFWAIHASRIGYEPGLVPLLLCPMLWALTKALRTGSLGLWGLAGILGGLGPYTYPAGRLFPAVMMAVLAIAWLWPRFVTPRAIRTGVINPAWRWRGVVLMALLIVLVAAPIVLTWAQNSELLLLRSRQIAVVAEGEGSTTPLQTTLDNTLATLGMFSLAGDIDPRNNLPGRPVFDLFLGLFFYLGVGLTLWRWRYLPYPWIMAALLVMLAPTILSDYAPHFRRALGAVPLVAVLTAVGLSALWDRAAAAWSTRRTDASWLKKPGVYAGAAVLVAVLLSAGLAARDYFDRWASSPDLFYAFDEGLWELAGQIDTQPPAGPAYLTPRPVTHTTLAFAWRSGVPPTSFDGRSVFVAPAARTPAITYAVIEDEDFRTPLLLPEVFPDAQIAQQIRDRQGKVYATVYRVPAGSAPALQPTTTSDATWDERVRLRGYALPSAQQEGDEPVYRPGDFIPVRLWWQPLAPIGEDWTLFAHLLAPDGRLLSGRDQQPGNGSYATSHWQVDDWIIDEVQLPVPADLAAGEYLVEIGFYQTDGTRLPVTTGAEDLDRLLIGPVRVAVAP